MAGTISEAATSRQFTLSRSSTRELTYNIVGTEDESEVESLIQGAAPSSYDGLVLDSIDAQPLGNGAWRGTARYNRVSGDEYTFDTGGGSDHITQSLETMGSYAPPGFTAPDFGGAIGVTEDKVEGVDRPAPKYEFSETHYFDDAAVTLSYKLALFNLTGKVNDATFKGFAAGECLFLGASGSSRGDGQWAITFRFACQPNQTGLEVGDITGIDKRGWDYLWIRYGSFADSVAHALVQRPIAVYVERVFHDGDFSGLGI